MAYKSALPITAALIIILVGIGTADALLTNYVIPEPGGEPLLAEEPEAVDSPEPASPERSRREPLLPPPEEPSGETVELDLPTEAPEQSEGTQVGPPPIGVRPAKGPNVLETLVLQEFMFQDTRETSLLEIIISEADVKSRVLMKDADRSGLIAWVESPRVKVYFLALKEALHNSFSPAVTDLVDEMQRREDRPTVNLLTFKDPAISEERIAFVRVRDRLYEFHIAQGNDDAIFALIDALTE